MDAYACESTPPRSCGRSTDPMCMGQRSGAVHEGEICIDVDTTSHSFHTTPHYVASFGGTGSEHHMTTGASSVCEYTTQHHTAVIPANNFLT